MARTPALGAPFSRDTRHKRQKRAASPSGLAAHPTSLRVIAAAAYAEAREATCPDVRNAS